MWREIKNLVLKKKNNVIKSVIYNQIEYRDNSEISNQFNNYFVDSIKIIRNSIENVQYTNQITYNIENNFKFRAINILELKTIIKKLKNKVDYAKISNKIILDNWNKTGEILLKIINKSLATGIFPENWKETMITPVEKVANTRKIEEYRPINTLKTCEKILEKVVKEQLEEYIEKNKILSKYQSGFRKKHSCETTVNYVISKWKNIEKNKKIMAIFLDFKRAFETIDREIMLKKLSMYGIQGTELKWFESYLKNRKQFTKVNDNVSTEIQNDFGVPQGSILGALLFIIYINDMPNVLEKCEMVLYADDTLIFAEGDDDDSCREKMNHDINNIVIWLKMNKLKLNENKTKIIEININSERTFKINNENIEKVEHIKYLGFIIDKELKLNNHIDYLCKKIGKKIGLFKRIRDKISKKTAINIYNTIIKPHFEYGSTIIFTSCNKSQLERMQKLQNKAMRVILKCNRYTHINDMLQDLKWMNIEQRLKFNTLIFIKKMKEGESPDYLKEQINYVRDVQPYHLRNAEDFRIQRVTTTQMKRSLFYKGLQLFNTLPNNMKTEIDSKLFRKKCVNFVRFNEIL